MASFVLDREVRTRLLRRIAAATRSNDPEDLLHSAFIRLEEYSARGKVENPSAFLLRAAVNLAHDQRRHRMVANPIEGLDLELLTISDDRPLQDEVLEARERLSRAQQALASLNPRTRDAFLMHRVEQLKYREIAARLGITVSAVEKHIAKAALLLARRMQGP